MASFASMLPEWLGGEPDHAMEEGPLLGDYFKLNEERVNAARGKMRLSPELKAAADAGEARRQQRQELMRHAQYMPGRPEFGSYPNADVVPGTAEDPDYHSRMSQAALGLGSEFLQGAGVVDYLNQGHKNWGLGADAFAEGDYGDATEKWMLGGAGLFDAGLDVLPFTGPAGALAYGGYRGLKGLANLAMDPSTPQMLRRFWADQGGTLRGTGADAPGMGDNGGPSLLETPVDQWPPDKLGFRSPTLNAVQSMVDDPKVQSKGTVPQMLQIAKKYGAKDNEIAWMNLGQGQEKITKEELLQQATERRIELEEVTLAGEAPVASLDTYSMDVNDEGMQVLSVEDRTSGINFEVIVDDDAGNVAVATEDGEWLDVEALTGAKLNNQNDRDGYEAIVKWLEGKNDPSLDAEGPLLYGPEEYGNLWTAGGTNPREVLLKMPHTPGSEVTPTDTAAAPFKAEWDRLNMEIDAAHVKVREAQLGITSLSDREYMQADSRLNDLIDDQDILHRQMVKATIEESGGRLGGVPYTGGHYEDAGHSNVIAHNRVQDMTYTDGKRGLHWDEGQSDWAKEGRKRGYAGDVEPSTSAVPDMPFKKNAWQTLNFKRMLRYAVENGYDRLTWAPGQVHKNRYGLEKHLDRIEINVSSRGAGKASEEPFTSGTLDAYNKDGQSTLKRHINSPEELEELVGKDVAKRLLGAEGKHTQRAGMGAFTREVKGADLKMGGEWADNLYDKQYPNIANKELKRLGIDQRVGRVDGAPKSLRYNVSDGSGLLNANLNRQQVDIVVPRYEMARGTPVTVETVTPQLHSIEITPELKEAVMGKGMTMFSAGGMLGGATAASMLSRYQGDEERPGI